jgi:hypothetical protein
MSTDTERRLRAALEASAELITERPGSADYEPPAANPDGGDQTRTRRRGRGAWVAPLLAAAAANREHSWRRTRQSPIAVTGELATVTDAITDDVCHRAAASGRTPGV